MTIQFGSLEIDYRVVVVKHSENSQIASKIPPPVILCVDPVSQRTKHLFLQVCVYNVQRIYGYNSNRPMHCCYLINCVHFHSIFFSRLTNDKSYNLDLRTYCMDYCIHCTIHTCTFLFEKKDYEQNELLIKNINGS